MNDNLISRDTLIEAFKDCTGECACCIHNTNDFDYCGLIDNVPTVDLEEISKIKEITERALRSEDPINLYKARALDEIAKILGIEIKEPEAEETDNKDQITLDDILNDPLFKRTREISINRLGY